MEKRRTNPAWTVAQKTRLSRLLVDLADGFPTRLVDFADGYRVALVDLADGFLLAEFQKTADGSQDRHLEPLRQKIVYKISVNKGPNAF